MLRRAALAILPALFLTACANTMNAEPDDLGVYDLSDELAPRGAPAPHVFVMQKGDATIAVFGTTHLVPERLRWLSPETERALARADVILTETSMLRRENVAVTAVEADDLRGRAAQPKGGSLWAMAAAQLGETRTAAIQALVAANDLDPARYDRLRPWVLCRDLQIPPKLRTKLNDEDRAMIAELGATFGPPDLAAPDMKIELYGLSNGIETMFLESEYERALNFSKLDDTAGLNCAAASATKPAVSRGVSVAEQYGALLDLWLGGDIEQARTMIERDQAALNPGWSRLFLQAREAAWLPRIRRACDAPGRHCFIAVGMAHLGGADGLLKGLESLGYRRAGPGS